MQAPFHHLQHARLLNLSKGLKESLGKELELSVRLAVKEEPTSMLLGLLRFTVFG